MRPLLAVLMALVLALASCGGDDNGGGGGGGSDEDEITAAIETFAANEGNPCDVMTDRFVEEAFETREQCQEESEESKGEDPTEIEFEDIEIDGDQATASIKADGEDGSVILQKEGDGWLIDRLEVSG